MNINDLRRQPCGLSVRDRDLLLCHALRCIPTQLLTRATVELSTGKIIQFEQLVRRAVGGEPIAYLLGQWEFYGLPLRVTRATLIPRPVTELLVDAALPLLQRDSVLLDIGTGSGCIPLALGKHARPLAIFATDISPAALAVARKNAAQYRLRITFGISDLLRDVPSAAFASRPPVITANLPYVPATDRTRSTRCEPTGAICAAQKGLALITRLLFQLRERRFTAVILEFHPPQYLLLARAARRLLPHCHQQFLRDGHGDVRVLVLRAR